jgi:hypothetical protein
LEIQKKLNSIAQLGKEKAHASGAKTLKEVRKNYRVWLMKVEEIKNGKRMLDAFEIRRKVFVVEQEVSAAEEYDEFEDSSIHLLALDGDRPLGTSRIRKNSTWN